MATDLLQGLFGPSPYEVGQARNKQALDYAVQMANMNNIQQAKMGIGQGAAGLAREGAGMLGFVDPMVEEAKRRDMVLAQGGDLTTSKGLKEKAAQFASAGDQQTAMKLLMLARKQEAEEIENERKKAITEREYQNANLIYEKALTEATKEQRERLSAYGQQLVDAGFKPGTPDFQKKMQDYLAAQITEKTKPTGTNISLAVGKGDSKYAETRLADVAKGMAELTKSAEGAYKSNQALDRFWQASKGGTQGGAQPIITGVQNFLSSFGYSAESLKDTRQMEQAIGDILGSKMAELGARGLTDKDMEVLRQALPRVNTDRMSRENVVKILKKANENVISEWEGQRQQEIQTYPELSKRIPEPIWYRNYKTTKGAVTPEGAYSDAEKERRYQEWKARQK